MGQTSFSPQISTSMPGFLDGSRGDNSLSSRPDVDKFFTKYDQYISRNQIMPWSSYIQIRSQVQIASRTLPTSEQLQLGGESSVRGYPEGDYLADSGGDMETEWYFPMYLIPSSWQWEGTKLKNDIEPFIFYDMGGGELLKVNNGETKSVFLSGTGAGIKIQLKKYMFLKLEWAVATGDKPVHGTGPSTFDVSFQAGI
jgi:hemolysin activation/secretion protein